MKIKKILIYLIVMVLLFQDTFYRILNIELFNYFDELIIIIMLVSVIIRILRRKKIQQNTLYILFLTIMFFITGIISCYLNSEFILSRVITSGFLSVKFFLVIIALANFNFDENIKKNIIEALEFFAKLTIIVAIFNFVAPNIYHKIFTFSITMYRFGIISITSLFYHTGKFGWYMLFMALLYYSKYKQNSQKSDKYWMIICAVFAALSLRTKVIISIIVIVIFENLINQKIKLNKILWGLILLICIVVVFKDVILNTYTLYFTEEQGISARQILKDNGIKIMKTYFPLGVGFGKYASWYAKVYYSEYYYKYNMNNIYGLQPSNSNYATDTFWPSIYGETGALGFVIYTSILIYVFVILYKKIKSKKSLNINFSYSNLALLALIQTICESFGEPSFNSAPQNIILGIIIGIALQREISEKEKIKNE